MKKWKKKNSSKKRPLGIQSGDDKLVQEVVKMILESIYEPVFSNKSHGFRPNRSCQTALKQIQNTFTGRTGLWKEIYTLVLIVSTTM